MNEHNQMAYPASRQGTGTFSNHRGHCLFGKSESICASSEESAQSTGMQSLMSVCSSFFAGIQFFLPSARTETYFCNLQSFRRIQRCPARCGTFPAKFLVNPGNLSRHNLRQRLVFASEELVSLTISSVALLFGSETTNQLQLGLLAKQTIKLKDKRNLSCLLSPGDTLQKTGLTKPATTAG